MVVVVVVDSCFRCGCGCGCWWLLVVRKVVMVAVVVCHYPRSPCAWC